MNKICVIGVYFGKVKNYFPLWIKSCQNNPKIDFLVFSDQIYDKPLPKNVNIIPFTLHQFKTLAISKLGITNISIDRPYKLCDFKPFYGEIFQDYVHQYEYWGHCDFDMLFGDIYNFLVKYEYQKYDKFSNLGHLSFYRNTTNVNHYYTLPGSRYNYLEVLTQNKDFTFDENAGIVQIYLKNNLPLFKGRLYADISHIYQRYKLSRSCSLVKKDINYKKQIFFMENGKVFRQYFKGKQIVTQEFMYIHFKLRPNFNINFNLESTNAFYITPYGFIPKNEYTINEAIKKFNRYSMIRESYEYLLFRILKIKKSIRNRLSIK